MRERYEMPVDVRQALEENGLMAVYEQRPPYQRNDYLGWILRAKRSETATKRIQQMLNELSVGGVYMGMAHPTSAQPAP